MCRVSEGVVKGLVVPTKRQMLSLLMSIYDPLGLLSPLVIKGKILFQELWKCNKGWDEHLNKEQFLIWLKWLDEVNNVRCCKVPRCYNPRGDIIEVQLHTFCDASEQAYAAVSYFRFVHYDGSILVSLVSSKSRVTPVKPVTIPRLELQAALLGARLAKTIGNEHKIKISSVYFWSDSITVLYWIRSNSNKFKSFVSHRLNEIDEITQKSSWYWVNTLDNPADLSTRCKYILDFSQNSVWFNGPQFLQKGFVSWPKEPQKFSLSEEANKEIREKIVNFIIREDMFYLPDINRFSLWRRLIRATAYVLLFIEKIKNKNKSLTLTTELLNRAERLWIKKCQQDSFSDEINIIKQNKTILGSSKLYKLSPMLDSDGVLRLKGRIDAVLDVPLYNKRPVILDGSHPYSKLLVSFYHIKANHASTEMVVNELRQHYWVINLRPSVRRAEFKCQVCRIKRARPKTPPIGDLPLIRLDHHKRPFTHVGLDYFGPMDITRGRSIEKRYGALFTCLVTRAVHLQLAGNLSADSAIMAIRRFIGRRGCPTTILSDNGTNFKGANRELCKAMNEVDWKNVEDEILNKGIKWSFNPAAAPHMGGAYERLVQAVKRALQATLKERAPREETLQTLLVEAEHMVNSRPLTYVSSDSRDLEALTPNHFLLGSSSGVPIPGAFDDRDLCLHKQWRISQRLSDFFWQRWVYEYLHTLVPRKGQPGYRVNVKKGDLVLIVDNLLPRNIWPRGVIEEVYPGKDGCVRVVDIRTNGGILRRPVVKIVLLPINNSDANLI